MRGRQIEESSLMRGMGAHASPAGDERAEVLDHDCGGVKEQLQQRPRPRRDCGPGLQ